LSSKWHFQYIENLSVAGLSLPLAGVAPDAVAAALGEAVVHGVRAGRDFANQFTGEY
jgi:hypothetical protein